MKWYLIRHEIDRKIIGKVNATQSLKMKDGYDYGAENSVYNIATKGFTDFNFMKTNFEKIELEPSAIYTDLISSMVINSLSVLIISDSFLACLNNFKLPQKFLKEVKVVHPKLNMELKYNAFFIKDQYNIIDFKKSDFLIKDNNETFVPWNTAERQKFTDESDLEFFFEQHTWKVSVRPAILKLKTNLDLFRLHNFGGFFISEELKKGIEHENLTGISFGPAENIFIEVP